MKPSDLFLRSQCRALTGCHVQSRSPANFQNPDCPETGRFPSQTPDIKKKKKKKKKIEKIEKKNGFVL